MRSAMILLPAYNEESSFAPLLEKIDAAMKEMGCAYRIVVCDDGSKDKTPDLLQSFAETFPIDIITHKINRGLGETSRDLFEYAAEYAGDDDVIFRMDCDDTHHPKYMPKMITKLDEGFDVVIASRFEEGGDQKGVDGYRALISRLANLFMKFFFNIKGVQEYSCGYRAYRAPLVKRAVRLYGNDFIQLKGLGFTCTLEKLLKLDLLGARFAEIGFVLRYDEKKSASKMVSSITTLGYIVMTIMYYWPWGGWRRAYRGLKDAK